MSSCTNNFNDVISNPNLDNLSSKGCSLLGRKSLPEEPFFSPEDWKKIEEAEEAEKVEKEMEKQEEIKRENISNLKMNLINSNDSQPPKNPPEILKNKEFKLKKARNWQFTLNDVSKWKDLEKYIMGLETLNYAVASKEIAPKTGHEHIHLYCQFDNLFKPSIKKLCGAHIERCFGTPRENDDYVRKVNDPDKRGEIILEHGELRENKNKFPTIKEVKEMSKEERQDLPLQYYNVLKKIEDEENRPHNVKDVGKDVDVYYIYGPSGYGKTLYAKMLINDLGLEFDMVKFENGFWSGVSGEREVALYDDFRDSDMRPREFINFIDYNIHNMNVKGSGVPNKYKYIFITSIQEPSKIYWEASKNNEELPKQWRRRMLDIDISLKKKEDIIDKYREIFGEKKALKKPNLNIV